MLKLRLIMVSNLYQTAAFRRLCVETPNTKAKRILQDQPPSGGCVLKQFRTAVLAATSASRLQAAVC